MKHAKALSLMVGVVLLLFASLSQAQLVTRAQLEPAIAAQERHTAVLMSHPEVVGTAVSATRGGQPIIKVYTKTAAGLAGLPARLDGFAVVPEVSGEIFAGKGGPGGGFDPTARQPRPVPIGVSTGHPDITAGTLGCRVTDGTDVWALSNNHVYANSNAAMIGDDVIQPGTFDGGSLPGDFIGTLDDFEPIDFSGTNIMDAAIAITTTALVTDSTEPGGYGTPRTTTQAASVGLRVMKYGRTTGQTKGRVDAINATVNVNYGAPGVATFVNQIVIIPGSFSAGGDSGSLVVVEKGQDARKPVGLLFAGSTQITIISPIDPILSRFGVTVDGDPN